LDEIMEMPSPLQSKVLRALETRSFFRVGGVKKVDVDVRLIAATNRNPDAAISSGDFRSDLFYRINSFEINIPPLRERSEDIKPLTRHILGRIAGVNAPEVSPSAMDALVSYSWPGNVRQLRNALERAVIMCDNGRIGSKDLPTEVLAGSRGPQGSFVSFPDSSTSGVPINLRQTERQQIINALKQTGWHRGKTAELLGISPSTLYRRLRGYELEVR
jgi:DNA-binding NtrC family response regulator